MPSHNYESSATHRFMLELRALTKAPPVVPAETAPILAQLQLAKRDGRKSVADIIVPSWRLLSEWRRKGHPIRFDPDSVLPNNVLHDAFARGPFGFCDSLARGLSATFLTALRAKRRDPLLANAFVEGDAVARKVMFINRELTRRELTATTLRDLPDAYRELESVKRDVAKQIEEYLDERFPLDVLFDDYQAEEVGPALHLIAGLGFVSLSLLQVEQLENEDLIRRMCRILLNSFPFVRDWATVSTAVFSMLLEIQSYSPPLASSLYEGAKLSNPACYAIAERGTEDERLEFDERMFQTRAIFERKLREEEHFYIGCGGLSIRAENDNVVLDSIRWATEIARAYGSLLLAKRRDY